MRLIDADKIVEQLKREKFIEQEVILSDIHQGFNAGLSRAIEIMKGRRSNMSLKNECSLKDCTKLRNLILKNPDLPLIIFAGEEAWSGEYGYNQTDASNGKVEELTLYKERWMNRDEYEEELSEDLADEEEYKNLSDKEYDEMIADKVSNTEFVKAIVVYVG